MSVSSDASSIIDHQTTKSSTVSIPLNVNLIGSIPDAVSSDSDTDIKKYNLSSSQLPMKNEIKPESSIGNNIVKSTMGLAVSSTPTGSSGTRSPLRAGTLVSKRRKSDDNGSMCSSLHESVETTENVSITPRKKNALRTQLAHQIISSSNKPLKKPSYVVRPANIHFNSSSFVSNNSHTTAAAHYILDTTCLLAIFRYLPQETLVTCSMVCKTWSTVSVDPLLWKRMNCGHHKLSAGLLTAIVRRQPENLILDWTPLAKRQLAWVVTRLPGLKNLSIQGTPISAVLGLHTCMCPPLQVLDLSFVRGLNDAAIRDILSPPKDSRPGLADSKSRLRQLKILKVAGTDLSDVALRYITQGVPSLVHLDLSSCQRITDAGVAQIGTCPSAINTLVELDLSSCKLVTESCLEYLSKCEALTWLDLRHVPQVSTQAVIKFAAKSKHNLHVRDIKLVDKRRTF